MGLGGRMAVAMAALGALAAAVVGAVTYGITASRLMDDVDADLQRTAAALVQTQTVGGAPEGTRVQQLDRSGAVVGATPDAGLPVTGTDLLVARGLDDAAIATANDPGRDGSVRVLTVASADGAIQVGRSLDQVDKTLGDLGRATAVVVAVVAILGALVGWVVALGVTQRLRRLTVAAEQVARHDRLDVAVPMSGRDEAGRLGREFDRMLTSLADSRRSQQQLVEDAGHELRTPLTSLRTNTDVLRRHADRLNPGDRAALLDDVDRDLTELATLVEEVVAVAANAPTDATTENVRLGDVASSVASRFADRSGRTITVDTDDSRADVDPTWVQRAIGNLIDNALKFDDSGGAITVTVLDGAVTVADRGPGIPPGEIESVFERFHRTPEARGLPGSGLGLAIVAKVTGEHGGTVFARNRTGGGAEVGFTLPVAHT